MRLNVLYDQAGSIVAASIDDEADEGGVPAPRPVPRQGQYAAEIEVPAEFSHLSFLDICQRGVVETDAREVRLRLVESKT
jgi:hypothetical protein